MPLNYYISSGNEGRSIGRCIHQGLNAAAIQSGSDVHISAAKLELWMSGSLHGSYCGQPAFQQTEITIEF